MAAAPLASGYRRTIARCQRQPAYDEYWMAGKVASVVSRGPADRGKDCTWNARFADLRAFVRTWSVLDPGFAGLFQALPAAAGLMDEMIN